MKGVIVSCLRELVVNKFGKDKWHATLAAAGRHKEISFLPTEDVDDASVLELVEAVRKILNMSFEQVAVAFGEYWACTYAPRIYRTYYQRAASAKEFLLDMDEVHRLSTERMPNAHPPRFEYSWTSNKTLIINYKSKRKLIDFMTGLIKGVGKHYKEKLQVSKLDDEHIQIVFS